MHVSRARFQAAILMAIVAAGALAAERQATGFFQARTNVVLINATVLDRNGRPVTGLTRERFRLFENKAEQRISYFAEEDLPLSLAVIFDTSGSMEGKTAGASRALSAMLDNSNRDDEFSLITFADRPDVTVPWTRDAAEVQNSAMLTRPRGRTSLLDAIHVALTQLHGAKNARRAVLILSDGGDNNSRYSERQISRMLEEADVQMYALDLSAAPILRERSVEEVEGPDLVSRLCDRAGGRYWQVDNQRDLAAAADQIERDAVPVCARLRSFECR